MPSESVRAVVDFLIVSAPSAPGDLQRAFGARAPSCSPGRPHSSEGSELRRWRSGGTDSAHRTGGGWRLVPGRDRPWPGVGPLRPGAASPVSSRRRETNPERFPDCEASASASESKSRALQVWVLKLLNDGLKVWFNLLTHNPRGRLRGLNGINYRHNRNDEEINHSAHGF